MNILSLSIRIIYLDCLSTLRRPIDWLLPILFFILIISIFPLAIPANTPRLWQLAPGIIWVAALLSLLLSLNHLFMPDHLYGALEQQILSPLPLPAIVLAKIIAHWLQMIAPLLLVVPLAALLLQISWHELLYIELSLVLGTPTLLLLGAIVLALTVNIPQSGLLLMLLLLPLFVPVLIFGSGLVVHAMQGFAVAGQAALLASFLLFSLVLAPWVIASALKIGING